MPEAVKTILPYKGEGNYWRSKLWWPRGLSYNWPANYRVQLDIRSETAGILENLPALGPLVQCQVELIVNGIAVDNVALVVMVGQARSNSKLQVLERSSWVALRIPAIISHSPGLRDWSAANRSEPPSAAPRWCRTCVDRVWEVKSPFIRGERETGGYRSIQSCTYCL